MASSNASVAAPAVGARDEIPDTGTVTVACKMPNGIYMTIYGMHDHDVPVLGGGMRTEKRAYPMNEPILIHGPAAPQGQSSKHLVIGGYAMTPNVPAQVAKKWMHDNRDSPLVQNKVVFIAASSERATSQATELKAMRSGFERLDPGKNVVNGQNVPKDDRWPRSATPRNLSDVDTAVLSDD